MKEKQRAKAIGTRERQSQKGKVGGRAKKGRPDLKIKSKTRTCSIWSRPKGGRIGDNQFG